jgi:hypothetical protein
MTEFDDGFPNLLRYCQGVGTISMEDTYILSSEGILSAIDLFSKASSAASAGDSVKLLECTTDIETEIHRALSALS